MKNLTLSIFLLIPLLIVFSFTRDHNTTPCQYAEKISAEQICYDPARGLTLTASGNDNNKWGLEWEVYVSKDTTIHALDDVSINKMGSEIFTAPDSILSDNPKVIVKVITNCQGQLLHSIYFSFVRRQVNNCTTWVEQRI